MPESPHSAEQFGPQRDFWWNQDFLDLMAKRWRLADAASLADIGCGRGHWSRLLYPYLRAPARLTGMDRETRWVAEAEQHFLRAFPEIQPGLVTFLQGDAGAIPLPDNSFEVVTCQTVLMHLARPREALREMMRILRPGGLLICVEPNNLWNYLAFTSLTADEEVEVIVRRFEFWLRYHRGKIALGLGDHTLGDLLPGWFAECGMGEIAVYQSDRVPAIFPPYNAPAQQALLDQEREWKQSSVGPWDWEAVSKQVAAGGGGRLWCEQVFKELIDKFEREQAAVATQKFHAASGTLTYLVSGRKPTRVASDS